MDLTAIWDAHLKAIVDEIAPGDPTVRGLKRKGFREVSIATRMNEEFIYQVYFGKKHVGKDFAETLDRVYRRERSTGWINVDPKQLSDPRGAADERVTQDTPQKREGHGLQEFLSYLNSLYPTEAMTPQEVIEEAEAYKQFAAERISKRILKHGFNAPGAASDARVEQHYGFPGQADRRQADPELVKSPLKRHPMRRASDKKAAK